MAVVIFDPAAFKTRYPEFAAVNSSVLQGYFDEATLYLSNTDRSPVQSIPRRTLMLNMLTAHVGQLAGALAVGNLPPPVGRVSQAAEGSVNASLEFTLPGTAAWFAQTPYGAAFWQATSSLRSMRYRARPTCY